MHSDGMFRSRNSGFDTLVFDIDKVLELSSILLVDRLPRSLRKRACLAKTFKVLRVRNAVWQQSMLKYCLTLLSMLSGGPLVEFINLLSH